MNNRSRRDVRRPRSRSNQGRSLVGVEYEVSVGPVAHGGHCVARHEGRVLFVRHALPGEVVVARVTDGGEKSRFLRADAVRILEPSLKRVAGGCRFAGPGGCGGCDWQHTTLSHQRQLKADVVREQLSRLAGIDWSGEVEGLSDDKGRGWRSRVEFTVDGSGRLGLREHRSHRVQAIDDCLIADPRIADVGLYEERFDTGVTGVDVVAASTGEIVAVELPLMQDEEVPNVQEVVTVGDREHSFTVGARGFWQVHPDAAPTFVAEVLRLLAPQPGEKALDLYCGVGLFSAFLADAVGAQSVTGIEGDEQAVHLAKVNVPGATFFANDVARSLQEYAGNADVVVLDPPRAGAGREVIEQVASLRPRAIAYVACDPAALARDIAYAAEKGYQVESIKAFDAFPMTHHVECIALLTPTH